VKRPATGPPQSRLRNVVQGLWLVIGGVPLGATVLGLVPGPWWFDLFNHFVPHLALAAALWGVGAAVVGSRVSVALCALTVVIQGARLAPELVAPASAAPDGRVVRVLYANVLGPNEDHAAVLDLIERLDPDVVGLIEVRPHWADAVDAALPGWSREVNARPDNFGLGLWSRLPMEASTEPFGSFPGIVARFDGFAVVLAHPPPPVSGIASQLRDDYIASVGRTWPKLGDRVAIVGDLNATPWSRPFRELVATGLSDTRAGRGLQGSWPTFVPSALGIPIDHVLVHGVVARERRIEAEIGSDHRPVYVELVVPY
jgi:endonuclease/exonuclease/phosphatase (EEP) superfamily protein YafD